MARADHPSILPRAIAPLFETALRTMRVMSSPAPAKRALWFDGYTAT